MDISNLGGQQVQQVVQPQVQQGANTFQPQVQQVVQPTPAVSTFTQEQVNAIVSQRVNDVNAKLSNQATELANIQSQLAQANAELIKYKHAEVLRNSNVNPVFNDFVEFSASKLAVNGKTYEQAVAEFTSQNPQYLQTMVSQSPVQENVTQQVSQTVGDVNAGQAVVQPVTQPQVQQVVTQPNMPVQSQIVPQVSNGVSVVAGNTGVNFSTQMQNGVVNVEKSQVDSILASRGYKIKI